MSASSRRKPGELEAEVLAVLWHADEPQSPGQVRDALTAELAYTTVMTILTRLHDKGSVTRSRAGRAYVYSPAFEQAEVAASQMRSLLDRSDDREAILTRFVGILSTDEERTLAKLLRHGRAR
jgi:predicted transcriptional regulator